MGQVNNVNDANFQQKVLDRLDKLERGTPMNNAAIGRGGIEVYDGGEITITNGGLSVTGTATITGTLEADGTITFTGNFTQTGPTVFQGTLSVEGVTTVKNDFNVTTGGKINVGSAMALTPSTDGGAVTFSNGAKVSSGSGAVNMSGAGGTSSVTAAGTSAGVTSGPTTLVVFNDGTWRLGTSGANIESFAAGVVDVTGTFQAGPDVYLLSLPVTTEKPNLYVGSDGVVKRSTATF